MDSWDELRTAFHVARAGTVSGAAEALGVHHATVIRHVDAVEAKLGVKLFQRHARGYTPTEAGADLQQVAQAAEDQFNQLASRLHGVASEVSGELVVTSLGELAAPLAPVLAGFQREYPGVVLRFVTGTRLFRLEYGEAHVAIRAGKVPEQPDNVVQKLCDLEVGLYASRDYAAVHGPLEGPESYGAHRFIGPDVENSGAPYYVWLNRDVPRAAVTFRITDDRAVLGVVQAGAGIGFLPRFEAEASDDLVEMAPARDEWTAPLWLVTHVDLHRTSKVQALTGYLKKAVKERGL